MALALAIPCIVALQNHTNECDKEECLMEYGHNSYTCTHMYREGSKAHASRPIRVKDTPIASAYCGSNGGRAGHATGGRGEIIIFSASLAIVMSGRKFGYAAPICYNSSWPSLAKMAGLAHYTQVV